MLESKTAVGEQNLVEVFKTLTILRMTMWHRRGQSDNENLHRYCVAGDRFYLK